MVGDFSKRKLAYFSNRANGTACELQPGLHGISNGVLESKWPKVERGKSQLQSFLDKVTDVEDLDPAMLLHDVMADTAKVQQPEDLPQTGMPVEIEHLMSSVFIEPCELKGAAYGTRSQTVLVIHHNGKAQVYERSRPTLDPEFPGCDSQWVYVQESISFSSTASS